VAATVAASTPDAVAACPRAGCTTAPNPVSSVAASPDNHRVYVSWTPAAQAGGVISYEVSATAAGSPTVDRTAGSSQTTTFLDNLVNGAAYRVAVYAVGETGGGVTTTSAATYAPNRVTPSMPTGMASCPGGSAYTPTITGQPDGGSIFTYTTPNGTFSQAEPPGGWSPSTASDASLAVYGWPAKPTDSAALQQWQADANAYSGFATPGACVPLVANSPASESAPDRSSGPPTSYNPVWAGGLAGPDNHGVKHKYSYIAANLIVPARQAPADNGTAETSWVGLGGYNFPGLDDGNLVQTGIDVGGNSYGEAPFAWTELYNNACNAATQACGGEVPTPFDFQPGETVQLITSVDNAAAATKVCFVLKNLSRTVGQGGGCQSLSAEFQGNAKFSTAEAVGERTGGQPLAKTGDVKFTGVQIKDATAGGGFQDFSSVFAPYKLKMTSNGQAPPNGTLLMDTPFTPADTVLSRYVAAQ